MTQARDEMRKLFCYEDGTEHEDDGKGTERKAQVTVVHQYQQPPGGKEHPPQKCIQNGIVQEPYRMEEVDFLPN